MRNFKSINLLFLVVVALSLTMEGCPNPGSGGPSSDGTSTISFSSTPVATVTEKQEYLYKATAEDSDGVPVTYALTKGAAWLSIDPNTGYLSGTAPRIKHEISLPITIVASRGTVSATQDFDLAILDVFDFTVSGGQSIQSVLDAAPAGSKIGVASGTYHENLSLGKHVLLVGTGSVSLLPATDSPLITIAASGVSADVPTYVRNFSLQTSDVKPANDAGKMTGILVSSSGPVSFVELDGLTVTGNDHSYKAGGGLESGLSISEKTSVSDLVVASCRFSHLSYGIVSGAIAATSPGYLKNVTIKDTTLDSNSVKGFYTERLSQAVFDNVSAMNNGNTALCPAWAETSNTGIDINLKYGAYENITLKNLTVSHNGQGSTSGAGVSVKARGTGNDASYNAVPATLTHVVIQGGTFSDNSTADVAFGEPDKNNTSPTDIAVQGATYAILRNALSGVPIQTGSQ